MSRSLARCAVALLLLPGLAAAAGDPWAATFGAAATGSYLDGSRPTVLLIGAGAEVDPAAAVAAFKAALRQSRRARLVMDSASVGEVANLDDQKIVKRAAPLPVDVIAILRLFPGDGGSETAVVTFYDKKGATLGALSVIRGTPLTPHPRAAGQGVSREAAAAVDRVFDEGRRPQAARATPLTPAQREFHAKAVSLEYASVERMWGSGDPGWDGPNVGTPPRALGLADFYETVGRADYAAFARRRAKVKLGLLVSGIVVAAGGAGMAIGGGVMAYAPATCLAQNVYGKCTDERKPMAGYALLGVGGGLAAAGLVTIIVAAVLDRGPISAQETYSLGLEHNRKLRQRLGLPDPGATAPVSTRSPARARPRLTLAPSFAPGGGGLTMGGAY
jgi:hypothetical protein